MPKLALAQACAAFWGPYLNTPHSNACAYVRTSLAGSPTERATEAPPERPEPHELRRQRKYVLEGRGRGSASSYRPYLQIERNGFQSRGRSHLVPDLFTGRQIHLLSDLELLTYLRLVRMPLISIQEQYPLERDGCELEYVPRTGSTPRGTVQVADELALRHPRITKLEARIMTTDFLVKFAHETVAVHVKYSDELSIERNRELRLIEQRYWKERGVRLVVITEKAFATGETDWMNWALDGLNIRPSADQERTLLRRLQRNTGASAGMRDRLTIVSSILGMAVDNAVRLLKHAILSRTWRPASYMDKPDLSRPWRGRIATDRQQQADLSITRRQS